MKTNKPKIRYFLYAVFFLLGLAILLYPTVSDRWNQYRANQLIATYTESVEGEAAVDYSEERAAADRYNEMLVGGEVPDVFAVRDGVEDKEYESYLNITGNGMMGYCEIPSINVYLPIYHYTNTEVLEKGCGHIAGSSLPVGGESTHTVISAHRGLPSAKMFTDLNLLEEGDTFYLHVLDETLAYEVDTILVVEPDETKSLAIEPGSDYCTLVTCTPYAVNTQRLLVRGHRVEFKEEVYQEAKEETKAPDKNMVWAQVLCVILGLLLSFLIVSLSNLRTRRKKAKKKKQ